MRQLKNNKGQAIVEFVLILPLILLMIFAMLETGRYVHAAYEVEHASREAARIGALGGTDSEILAGAIASANGIDTTKITVQITPSQLQRASGNEIRVSVSYQFTTLAPFVSAIYQNGMTISSTISMRVE